MAVDFALLRVRTGIMFEFFFLLLFFFSYLGNFAVIEDYRLFGFVGNSGIRIVLCTDDGDPISKVNMKAFFEAIQQLSLIHI